MRTFRWTLLLGLCLLVSPTRLGAASTTRWLDVAVRIYDAGGHTRGATAKALDVAGRRMMSAGVDVRWVQCRGTAGLEPNDECLRPITTGFAIRFVRTPVAHGYQGLLPLGDALIDRGAGRGLLGTVYVDRVRWLAHASGSDVSTITGGAIAHELGHLIMGTTGHTQTGGLMRPVWTPSELRRNDDADWQFASPDVAAMRAAAERL